MLRLIIAHTKDNVATIVQDVAPGDVITIGENSQRMDISVNNNIPCYHKVALADIKKGEAVIKYGEVIGKASSDIKRGDYVHIHNLESTRGRGDIKS
ncbi:UxaA family hydrolase [Alkaliphilus pronyensis]|uniref:UxaA family hydrolase n=1 Tax=Alkaliphilus pronyensis TaxID=1482732 RepID=A0A6I0FFF2_9FIRM|nr:UxaA family hydrolase [Alkaliphilus pronyensis]KAB3536963.1 UxaA family hydrolase [Alkaliphilus pronyensis]